MNNLLFGNISDERCLVLIGMAGAGKSTLGAMLARRLGWAHLDTDRLVEAVYGHSLQNLVDRRGVEEFVRMEEATVADLSVRRCVVSTGGSVVYGQRAVARLRESGPVVFLSIDLETFLARVRDASGRGFARAKGKTMEDVFRERRPLYEQAADYVIDTAAASPEECVAEILDRVSL